MNAKRDTCVYCRRALDELSEAEARAKPESLVSVEIRKARIRTSPVHLARIIDARTWRRVLFALAPEEHMTPAELAEQDAAREAAREIGDEITTMLTRLHDERYALAATRRVMQEKVGTPAWHRAIANAIEGRKKRDPGRDERIVAAFTKRIAEPGARREVVVAGLTCEEDVTARHVNRILRAAGMGRKVKR
jgi:hypothetical protein